MPRKRFPDPFFFFDEANASRLPRPVTESSCAFFRRLDTDDGARIRELLNRCLARYTKPKKRRDMMSRLEGGSDREQKGVIYELLMGEILSAVSSRIEIEPRVGATGSPDFRIWDANQNSIIVEATHFMDSSDERHRESLAWEAIVEQVRPIVRPLPAVVDIEALGHPADFRLSEHQERTLDVGIKRSLWSGMEHEVRMRDEFSIRISAEPAPSLQGKDSLAHWDHEFPEGVIDTRAKLRRIAQIVKTKSDKYGGFFRPFVVAVNCPSVFLWLDGDDRIEDLRNFLAGVAWDAVWLFQNLHPWNIGRCKSVLIKNPESDHAAGLQPVRRAQSEPLYEVLGLGPEWNRHVGWDRQTNVQQPDGPGADIGQ